MTLFLTNLLCFIGGLLAGSLLTWAHSITSQSKGDNR